VERERNVVPESSQPLNSSTSQPFCPQKNREEKIEFSSRVEVIG
jgi:hypothetical protein